MSNSEHLREMVDATSSALDQIIAELRSAGISGISRRDIETLQTAAQRLRQISARVGATEAHRSTEHPQKGVLR